MIQPLLAVLHIICICFTQQKHVVDSKNTIGAYISTYIALAVSKKSGSKKSSVSMKNHILLKYKGFF